ncbi:hypothetical protein AMTRI_Chr10g2810 [Amborella trichopoda]
MIIESLTWWYFDILFLSSFYTRTPTRFLKKGLDGCPKSLSFSFIPHFPRFSLSLHGEISSISKWHLINTHKFLRMPLMFQWLSILCPGVFWSKDSDGPVYWALGRPYKISTVGCRWKHGAVRKERDI